MSKLKQWLMAKSWTAEQLAAALGKHRVTVFRYLRAEDMPRPQTVARIEAVTEGAITSADLFADYQARREKA